MEVLVGSTTRDSDKGLLLAVTFCVATQDNFLYSNRSTQIGYRLRAIQEIRHTV
jgi:hypothetical protein